MSDFDPDAYLEQQSTGTVPFDPDAHLSNAVPTVAHQPGESEPGSTYDTELEEAKGNPLVTSKDFYKGLARGALRTFEGATGGNQQAVQRDVAQRLGVSETPEAIAGEAVGGFMAPLPGGPLAKAGEAVAAVPHPLQGVADAEASRISGSLEAGRAKGITLPERIVSPNQQAANGIVQEDLNLPKGAPITPTVLDAARKQFGAPAYQAVQNVPKIQLGSAYEEDIGNVDTSLIKDKFQPPPGGSITGARAVELSKYLREKASAYFHEGTVEATEKGQAHWDAAQAVEDAVERRLKATGQGQTAADWDNARTYYAKTYSVQSALDGAGNVVVPKLKTQLIKGKPLSGGIQDLATMGAANPEAFKATPQAPQVSLPRRIGAKFAQPLGTAVGGTAGGLLGFPTTGAVIGNAAGEKLSGVLNPYPR
jgi:hypothetical protein